MYNLYITMKKLAICISGIHYKKNHRACHGAKDVDYRNYVDNHKKIYTNILKKNIQQSTRLFVQTVVFIIMI
jgi:hypothetical protein